MSDEDTGQGLPQSKGEGDSLTGSDEPAAGDGAAEGEAPPATIEPARPQRAPPSLPHPRQHGVGSVADLPEDSPLLRRVEQELAEPSRLGRAETKRGHVTVGEEARQAFFADDAAAQSLQEIVLRPETTPLQELLWRHRWPLAAGGGVLVLLLIVWLVVALSGDEAGSAHSARSAAGSPARGGKKAKRAKTTERAARLSPGKGKRAGKGGGAKVAVAAEAPETVDLGARAREQLDKGLCPAAARTLRAKLARDGDAAETYRLLGQALICQSRLERGLAAYGRAVEMDPAQGQHEQILADAGFLLSRKATRLAAVDLLARIGKPAGALLANAATHQQAEVRKRALAALQRIGAEDSIDWPTVLWLDLKQARNCAARRAAVKRMAQLDDPRVPKLLRNARTRRNACVRRDIDRALRALRRRAAKQRR